MVILVGAGISKDNPSNLPSWWEFNMLLLKSINLLAACEIPDNKLPLNEENLEQYIPVVAVSDFLMRGAMGEAYFPLLKLLDGSRPNNNHYALAQMAKTGKINTILTTNFDTLLEQAFKKLEVPFRVVLSDEDFRNYQPDNFCAILKLHGSITSESSLIDTVTQKLKGLSESKRQCIAQLLQNEQLCVMGFSGDDFRFGEDYIPIQQALQYQSITWIKHPGSSINEHVQVLATDSNFILQDMFLSDYFKKHSVNPYLDSSSVQDDTVEFKNIALPKMLEAMSQINMGSKTCLGLCIQLLQNMGEHEKAIELADLAFSQLHGNTYFSFEVLILLFNIGIVYMGARRYDEALRAFSNALHCVEVLEEFAKENFSPKECQNALDESNANLGAIYTNIGLCYMERGNSGDQDKAVASFIHARDSFMKAKKTGNVLRNSFNLSRWLYKYNNDQNAYLESLLELYKFVPAQGEVRLAVDILCDAIRQFIEVGEYDSAWKYIKTATTINDLQISVNHDVLLSVFRAELFARRNQKQQCVNTLQNIWNVVSKGDPKLQKVVAIAILRLISHWTGCDELIMKAIDSLEISLEAKEHQFSVIKSYGCLSEKPVFLDEPDINASKESILRQLIIYNEYDNNLIQLPKYFCQLAPAMDRKIGEYRQLEINYNFYMATTRIKCGILQYESMLRYASSLYQTNNNDLARDVVEELIGLPESSDDEYQTILGCACALLSSLMQESGDDAEAERLYNKSLQLLGSSILDLKVAVYNRANCLFRCGMIVQAESVLRKDMPVEAMTLDEVESLLQKWTQQLS